MTDRNYLQTGLERLEAEAIHIIREVAATCERPVLLYSMGKDSSVLLHLCRKAFHPGRIPFPLLHIDSTWEFRAMYDFREQVRQAYRLDVLVHANDAGLQQGINPFDTDSRVYTYVTRTKPLIDALALHRFDAALGGARRDEERSRAKERVFSLRDAASRWDPKSQRPELWNIYNTQLRSGESLRVFPLSNWTELDVWMYALRESIPLVPLYFAAERPVVERNGVLIVVDDERMRLQPGETPRMEVVRFRTLGCYPLTGAVRSAATSIPEIIEETIVARASERQGRVIDHDEDASMELKKREGYF